MKLMRYIRTELQKMSTGYCFYVCTAAVLILFFFGSVEYDYAAEQDISVLHALLHMKRTDMLQNPQYCAENVLYHCQSGWLKMFSPMLAAFPYVIMHSTEQAAGARRFRSVRVTKRIADWGSFLTAMLCGGAVLLTAFVLFFAAVMLLFPHFSQYDEALRAGLSYPISGTLRRFPDMMLYGAASAVPAWLLTAFMQNKYLIVSFPYFCKYMCLQGRSFLFDRVFSESGEMNRPLLSALNLTDPDFLLITHAYSAHELRNTALIATAAILCCILIYRRISAGRLDYGA